MLMSIVCVCFRFIALPIGRRYGLQETIPRAPVPNALLEEAYKKYRKAMPNHDNIVVSIYIYIKLYFRLARYIICAQRSVDMVV